MRPIYLADFAADSPTTYLGLVPDGRDGTFKTLTCMVAIVKAWKRSPDIRALAISITRALPNKDYRGEVELLFNYVRDRIRYVQDISDIETLHTPDVILAQGAGDCDDKAILLASLLESIGHKTAFTAQGWENNPEYLSHVSVQTRIGTVWVNCETTENVPLGWTPNPPPTDTLTVYN